MQSPSIYHVRFLSRVFDTDYQVCGRTAKQIIGVECLGLAVSYSTIPPSLSNSTSSAITRDFSVCVWGVLRTVAVVWCTARVTRSRDIMCTEGWGREYEASASVWASGGSDRREEEWKSWAPVGGYRVIMYDGRKSISAITGLNAVYVRLPRTRYVWYTGCPAEICTPGFFFLKMFCIQTGSYY